MKKYLFIKIILFLSILNINADFKEDIDSMIKEYLIKKNSDIILHYLSKNKNQTYYKMIESYLIEKAKNFILNNDYISGKDIFDTVLKSKTEVASSTDLEKNKKEIDNVINNYVKDKKKEIITDYIKKNSNNKNYYEIEKYLIQKSKETIINNDYETARLILSTILNINMDNKEAEEIYLSIQNLKKEEQIVKVIKKEKEEEKKLKNIYNEIQEAKKISFKNFIFYLGLGALDSQYYQSQFYYDYYNEQKNNFKYGLNAFFSFYFYYPYVSVGLDTTFDSYFVNFNNASGYNFNFKILLGIATPLMRVPLYLRAGYAQNIFYFTEDQLEDVFLNNLFSPVIGLEVKDYYFNKVVGIAGTFDYFLISFFTSYFNAAFDTSLSILTRFYSIKNMNLYIKSQIYAFFLIGDKGKLENNIKLQISLGINFNEK